MEIFEKRLSKLEKNYAAFIFRYMIQKNHIMN